MTILSDLEKTFKAHHILVIIGALVFIYALYTYSDQKFLPIELNTNQDPVQKAAGAHGVAPAAAGNEGYASVSGMNGPAVPGPNASRQPVANPADLLPRDANSQWGSLNPAGNGDLTNQNLLSAAFLAGIDTVGNTMKNPNLQVRSEPPNPQLNVGPWNNSTFAPDLMRVPLEIGVGSQ
jgi:hypothetical protein